MEREQSNSLHVGDVLYLPLVFVLCMLCPFVWVVIFGMFRTFQKCVYILVPCFPYARLSVIVRDEMSLPSHLGYFDPTIEFGMFSTLQKCVYIIAPYFPYACLSVIVWDEMSLPILVGYFVSMKGDFMTNSHMECVVCCICRRYVITL